MLGLPVSVCVCVCVCVFICRSLAWLKVRSSSKVVNHPCVSVCVQMYPSVSCEFCLSFENTCLGPRTSSKFVNHPCCVCLFSLFSFGVLFNVLGTSLGANRQIPIHANLITQNAAPMRKVLCAQLSVCHVCHLQHTAFGCTVNLTSGVFMTHKFHELKQSSSNQEKTISYIHFCSFQSLQTL